jgi:hypothetical protein
LKKVYKKSLMAAYQYRFGKLYKESSPKSATTMALSDIIKQC